MSMFDFAEFSDERLQALCLSGSRDAETELIRRYAPLVERCTCGIKAFGGEQTDLVQEGMFGLVSAIRQYRPEAGASFRTFAEHCIRNRIHSAVKSASRKKHFPLKDCLSYEQLSEESDSRLSAVEEIFQRMPEDLVLARESREELFAALSDCLSALEKRVLHDYLNGLSYQEIAANIGKDQKSVDNAVQRIRRKLARNLNLGDFSKS